MAISLYEMRLLGIIVVVFIILHWIFVSMNATAMRFHAGMSHVKLFNFRNFFQWKKSVQVVANSSLIKCAIILICLYAPSHIWSTRKIRKKIALLIMKRSVEITQEQHYSQRCVYSSFLVMVYVIFLGFLDCYFATIKDLCCKMSVRDRQTNGLVNWL